MLYPAIELAMVILFLVVLADALIDHHRCRKKLLLLVLAVIYAAVFENFNMLLSRGHIGSYFYNPGFSLYVWQTPLFVILAWACLIYTAMHITDMLNIKTLTKPFLDALIVLSIDLTLDVVAVRQGIWTWVGYSQNQGWFGVPAENFVGWLFAVFIFSFLFRYFERREDDMINKTTRTEYYFLLPAFAYLAMLILFSLVNLAEQTMKLTKAEELFVMFGIVIFFAAMIRTTTHKTVRLLCTDSYTIFAIIFTRLLFYSYIIWSVTLMKLYEENITLILIIVATITAELLIYHSAFGQPASQKSLKT